MNHQISVLNSVVAWNDPADAQLERKHLMQRVATMAHEASALTTSQHKKTRKMGFLFLKTLLKGFLMSREQLDAKVAALPKLNDCEIVKLSDWIAYAKAAKIDHVPIEQGPSLTVKEIEDSFEALDTHNFETLPEKVRSVILPWILQQQERGWMWRFETCATATIKSVLGCIRPPQYIKSTKISVPFSIDERVLHILWGSQLKEQALLSRPWVQAEFHEGFPVEFRVFRTPDGWAACNYYVQRALPERYRQAMEDAVQLTQQFENTIKTQFGGQIEGLPPFPKTYTVDWLLSDTGKLMIIEAGPPFTLRGGAHPCCFSFENVKDGSRLLAGEKGSQFYCPPDLQALVDKVKNGEHPLKVAKENNANPMAILSYASVQGYYPAQAALKAIEISRNE